MAQRTGVDDPMSDQTQQMVPATESHQIKTLRDLLYKYKDRIGAVIPAKVLTVDRLLQLAAAACARDQKLLACSPLSILRSVMVAAQLGLDPTGVLGQGYLVPFRNGKTGRYEATFIAGYKGLLDLARRSERVLGAEARIVVEGELFEYEEGIHKVLRHKPRLEGTPDSQNVRGAYAVVRLRDDPVPMTEWMTVAMIEAIRKRSRAGNEGPWVSDFPQMARKSVLRRIMNYAPQSPELQKALAIEDRFEEGERDISDIIEMPVLDESVDGAPSPQDTKSGRVLDQLKNARKVADATAIAGQAPPAAAPAAQEPSPSSPTMATTATESERHKPPKDIPAPEPEAVKPPVLSGAVEVEEIPERERWLSTMFTVGSKLGKTEGAIRDFCRASTKREPEACSNEQLRTVVSQLTDMLAKKTAQQEQGPGTHEPPKRA